MQWRTLCCRDHYLSRGRTHGFVVYIKSSLTGDEPADVMNYKKEDSAFPHDSTLNQWFSESQFESYRRLGHHVAFSVFEPAGAENKTVFARRSQSEANTSNRFGTSGGIQRRKWTALPRLTPPATKSCWQKRARTKTFLASSTRCSAMRKSGKLHTAVQYEAAIRFSSELIEFIFIVFNQLDLVLLEKRDHPYAQGWSRIFNKWAQIDAVQDGWKRYRESYSPSFQMFAQSADVGLPSD